MTTYQSKIKTISSSEEVVFGILSDLNNLGKIKDDEAISGKLKILDCDADSCLLELNQIGKVKFNIIERIAFKTIRFESSQFPFELNASIQLNQIAENETQIQMSLNANLPAVIKMMLNKKFEQGIDTLADFFADFLNNHFK